MRFFHLCIGLLALMESWSLIGQPFCAAGKLVAQGTILGHLRLLEANPLEKGCQNLAFLMGVLKPVAWSDQFLVIQPHVATISSLFSELLNACQASTEDASRQSAFFSLLSNIAETIRKVQGGKFDPEMVTTALSSISLKSENANVVLLRMLTDFFQRMFPYVHANEMDLSGNTAMLHFSFELARDDFAHRMVFETFLVPFLENGYDISHVNHLRLQSSVRDVWIRKSTLDETRRHFNRDWTPFTKEIRNKYLSYLENKYPDWFALALLDGPTAIRRVTDWLESPSSELKSMNIVDAHGNSLLMLAVSHRNDALITKLMSYNSKINVNIMNEVNQKVITLAEQSGSNAWVDKFRALLPKKQSSQLLREAIAFGEAKDIKALTKADAKVAELIYKYDPVMSMSFILYAIYEGKSVEFVQALISCASEEMQPKMQAKLVFQASLRCDLPMVTFLLDSPQTLRFEEMYVHHLLAILVRSCKSPNEVEFKDVVEKILDMMNSAKRTEELAVAFMASVWEENVHVFDVLMSILTVERKSRVFEAWTTTTYILGKTMPHLLARAVHPIFMETMRNVPLNYNLEDESGATPLGVAVKNPFGDCEARLRYFLERTPHVLIEKEKNRIAERRKELHRQIKSNETKPHGADLNYSLLAEVKQLTSALIVIRTHLSQNGRVVQYAHRLRGMVEHATQQMFPSRVNVNDLSKPLLDGTKK